MKKIAIISGVLVILAGSIVAVLVRTVSKRRVQTNQTGDMYTNKVVSEIKTVKGTLVKGFPEDFPVYPGATLVESKGREKPLNTSQDLQAEWVTQDPVKEVMEWYVQALHEQGWIVETPVDPEAVGEQVTHIEHDNLKGYVGVELEAGETQIVVDFSVAD